MDCTGGEADEEAWEWALTFARKRARGGREAGISALMIQDRKSPDAVRWVYHHASLERLAHRETLSRKKVMKAIIASHVIVNRKPCRKSSSTSKGEARAVC